MSSGVELRALMRWWRPLFGPAIALISGLASVFLFRRGIHFAPVAAASVLVAWTLVTTIDRWLPGHETEGQEQKQPPIEQESTRPADAVPAPKIRIIGSALMGLEKRKIARWLARYVIVALYQDALFFLLPLWFGSATWPSGNVAAPMILALLAVASCFDFYQRYLLEHPLIRTASSALILFATLVASLPVVFAMPLLWNVAISAVAGTLLLAFAILPKEILRSLKGVAAMTALCTAAAGTSLLFAPFLPPVPVQCFGARTALQIRDREPLEPGDLFVAPKQVYAWFAVAAPKHFVERVQFRWFHEGEPIGRGFATDIVGGRKTGFRTWGFVTAPRSGQWRVDLEADSGQLIGRRAFLVRSSTVSSPLRPPDLPADPGSAPGRIR